MLRGYVRMMVYVKGVCQDDGVCLGGMSGGWCMLRGYVRMMVYVKGVCQDDGVCLGGMSG